ncbi:hypothetical protein BpHYR1_046465 [Brachionus plicatilis]|uniref:Uncharacterized protein n=1 Tax=Brachionus plicatilis TaxID=10195 RepID=A0A3M7Q8I9_BRAPC|nr:hypothetical protein BpHYR1_046465 [Brachionus plicatilis]
MYFNIHYLRSHRYFYCWMRSEIVGPIDWRFQFNDMVKFVSKSRSKTRPAKCISWYEFTITQI